jgi:curli biogenesis system outer membrane secretion channel CsgG
MTRFTRVFGIWACSFALTFGATAALADDDDPVVDNSRTSDRLESLPRAPLAQRPVVTIYEFRSGVPEVADAALTDMFTTALVKSGQFRVVERQRLAQGIAQEKQMNAQGMTTGNIAPNKITGASYIFEGAVSEANPNQDSTSGGMSVYGMNMNGNKSAGEIAIDVRVDDANSGEVLDAIDVKKKVKSSGGGVSGVGNLIGAMGGGYSPVDANVQTQHNDGVDAAVRSCIEAAVLELVHRYGPQGPAAAAQ